MQRGPGRPPKIDRELLHQYLWEHRGRGDYMSGTQGELAEQLGVTQATLSLIMKELAIAGRLTKVGHKFRINSPDVSRWEADPETLF